jgi:hypothetical protein
MRPFELERYKSAPEQTTIDLQAVTVPVYARADTLQASGWKLTDTTAISPDNTMYPAERNALGFYLIKPKEEPSE